MDMINVLFVVAVCANLALTVFIWISVTRTVGRLRREAQRADEIARTVQAEWELFSRNHAEQIRQKMSEIEERTGTLENRVQGRVADVERQAGDTRIEVERIERYIREAFEVELKNVFDSFDATVAGVLDEMKREMLRGVDRIEEIQSMVESRDVIEGRLAEGKAMIQSLTNAMDKGLPRPTEQKKPPADATEAS